MRAVTSHDLWLNENDPECAIYLLPCNFLACFSSSLQPVCVFNRTHRFTCYSLITRQWNYCTVCPYRRDRR